MGCGGSSYSHIYSDIREIGEYKDRFLALGMLEEDVGKLYELFSHKIDRDQSNNIEVLELLMFLDVERTTFTERIFSIFDDDHSGLVDFHEFVFSMWNYCTLGTTSLILFAFDLYDQDKSGYIDKDELLNLVKDVYGSKFEQNVNAKKVYNRLQALELECIDVQTFQNFSKKHQATLYPAFEMQTLLKKKVFGDSFWARFCQYRFSKYGEKYVPITQIIKNNVKYKHAKKRKFIAQYGDLEAQQQLQLEHERQQIETEDDFPFNESIQYSNVEVTRKPSNSYHKDVYINTQTVDNSVVDLKVKDKPSPSHGRTASHGSTVTAVASNAIVPTLSFQTIEPVPTLSIKTGGEVDTVPHVEHQHHKKKQIARRAHSSDNASYSTDIHNQHHDNHHYKRSATSVQ